MSQDSKSALQVFLCLVVIFNLATSASLARHSKDLLIKLPSYPKPTNPYTADLSPMAIQLSAILGIEQDLKTFETLKRQMNQFGTKPSLELRQDLSELKIDLIAAIEQARLDIDFVCAEMEDEHVRHLEFYQACTDEQTKRIVRANVNAFRTNGVLWAVAEALSIPTYQHPKYSIPSGTIGIIAGIVPSIFSLYAVRGSKEHYSFSTYPNMLCKFFDYPVTPRCEYPKSVWDFLNAKPIGEAKRSRKEILIDHWLADKNLHCFKKRDDKNMLDLLTGTKQDLVTPDILADQLLMLRETKAIVLQMNRALMELMMVVRGQKQLASLETAG